MSNIKLEDVFNYDVIKENLIIRLCNLENINPDVVYNDHVDFAETFHILISDDEDGIKTIPVTHNLVHVWAKNGYSVSGIHHDAIKSSMRLAPVVSFGISEYLGISTQFGEDATVITTESGIYGAAAILYPDVLNSVCDKFKSDSIIILPSSIHEVIALPMTKEYCDKGLDDMVAGINAAIVDPSDVLGDKAYCYSKSIGGIAYLSDIIDELEW